MCIFMFASAVSALLHDDANFNGIFQGSLSFLMMCLGKASDEMIDQIFEELVLFTSVRFSS